MSCCETHWLPPMNDGMALSDGHLGVGELIMRAGTFASRRLNPTKT